MGRGFFVRSTYVVMDRVRGVFIYIRIDTPAKRKNNESECTTLTSVPFMLSPSNG